MENNKGLIERVKILEKQVHEIVKILDEINLRIKDIDMDVDELFDEIEGDKCESSD